MTPNLDILKELQDLGLTGNNPKAVPVRAPVPPKSKPKTRTEPPKEVPILAATIPHPALPSVLESFLAQIAVFETSLQGLLTWCEITRTQLTTPIDTVPAVSPFKLPKPIEPTTRSVATEEKAAPQGEGFADDDAEDEDLQHTPSEPLLAQDDLSVAADEDHYETDDPAAPDYTPDWNKIPDEEKSHGEV